MIGAVVAMGVICIALYWLLLRADRRFSEECERWARERAALLQRLQDPAQASIDHSIQVAEPQTFIPYGDDEEVNEIMEQRG